MNELGGDLQSRRRGTRSTAFSWRKAWMGWVLGAALGDVFAFGCMHAVFGSMGDHPIRELLEIHFSPFGLFVLSVGGGVGIFSGWMLERFGHPLDWATVAWTFALAFLPVFIYPQSIPHASTLVLNIAVVVLITAAICMSVSIVRRSSRPAERR